MMKLKLLCILIIILPLNFLFSSGNKESITTGNKLLKEGNIEDALSIYEKAELKNPESPYIYFNKGLAHFRLEDYEAAKEEFLEAAIKTKDLSLEAKAYYNLGNCTFFEAARYTETDLQKAIELYQESINNYQRAIERDKKIPGAAHNIEVTRLIVKDLLDKLKKQQEQNKEQQEKQQEIAKKLAELIEREQKQVEYTTDFNEEKNTQGLSNSLKNSIQKVKKEQSDIRKETIDVSGKIDEMMQQGGMQQPQPGSPLAQAKEHVDISTNYQHLAENQLGKYILNEAVKSEEGARDELIKALQALAGQSQGDGEQNKEEEQKKQEQEKEQQEKQAQAEEAKDILNEEEENKRKREAEAQAGYYAPAKDW